MWVLLTQRQTKKSGLKAKEKTLEKGHLRLYTLLGKQTSENYCNQVIKQINEQTIKLTRGRKNQSGYVI